MVSARAQSLNLLTFVSLLPSVGSNANFQNKISVIIQKQSHLRKTQPSRWVAYQSDFHRFIFIFLIYKLFFKVVFFAAIKQKSSRDESVWSYRMWRIAGRRLATSLVLAGKRTCWPILLGNCHFFHPFRRVERGGGGRARPHSRSQIQVNKYYLSARKRNCIRG